MNNSRSVMFAVASLGGFFWNSSRRVPESILPLEFFFPNPNVKSTMIRAAEAPTLSSALGTGGFSGARNKRPFVPGST